MVLWVSCSFAFEGSDVLPQQEYFVYSCKDNLAIVNFDKCEYEVKGTAIFKVLANKNEVYVAYSFKDGRKSLSQLDDCKVINEKNWMCGGKVTTSNDSYTREAKYQMIESDVYTEDFYQSMKDYNRKETKYIIRAARFKRK